jgi:hypothetical protein
MTWIRLFLGLLFAVGLVHLTHGAVYRGIFNGS